MGWSLSPRLFPNECHGKMLKIKNGNFHISQLFITINPQYLWLNTCVWGWKTWWNRVSNVFLKIKKYIKIEDSQFRPKFRCCWWIIFSFLFLHIYINLNFDLSLPSKTFETLFHHVCHPQILTFTHKYYESMVMMSWYMEIPLFYFSVCWRRPFLEVPKRKFWPKIFLLILQILNLCILQGLE